MQSLLRLPLAVAAALAVLVSAGAAQASIPDRVAQDDGTVVCRWHDRGRALMQMRNAGFSHVRINVIHAPDADGVGLVACALPATLEDYDRAVDAVRAAGLIPQVTFVWSHASDPGAISSWMGEMAAHFASRVQRFSVLNEPDLTIPAADSCDPETLEQLISVGLLDVSTRMQMVKVPREGYRYRFVRSADGHRFVLARVRAYRWVRRPVRVIQQRNAAGFEAVTTVKQGCVRLQRGRLYHEIYRAAEPAIRVAAPGAQVLAGETSPVAGVDVFIANALPLNADGWAHHCYQWDTTPDRSTGGFGIGDTARVQALVGMPLFLTECGYPNPDSEWNQTRYNGFFTHDNVTAAYPVMWQYARDQGVREMSQFGWCQTPTAGRWDTSLMTGESCDEGPEYRALQTLIAGWL
jgi:hypothetical protein